MKRNRVVLAFVLVALLGSAGGQSPAPTKPGGGPPPVTITAPGPLGKQTGPPSIEVGSPSLPVPGSDEAKLLGAWTVVFSDNEAFKKCRMTFNKETLTVNDGTSNISVPFEVKQGNQGKFIAFRVLGTQWTGLFGVVGEDVATFRFSQPPTSSPPVAGRAFSLVVMEREKGAPATPTEFKR
jgi:hypothetical protein